MGDLDKIKSKIDKFDFMKANDDYYDWLHLIDFFRFIKIIIFIIKSNENNELLSMW